MSLFCRIPQGTGLFLTGAALRAPCVGRPHRNDLGGSIYHTVGRVIYPGCYVAFLIRCPTSRCEMLRASGVNTSGQMVPFGRKRL